MTKYGWWVIAFWAGSSVATVDAALPPLPPAGWPIGSIRAYAEETPLPQGAPDGADGVGGDAPAHDGPQPFDQAAHAVLRADTAAPVPQLEGPPIPLPPPVRMSDAAARHPGDADDARRISLNLQGAGLAAAFDALARFTGLNIIVGEQVRGTVTLRLNNVRWRDAFDTLLDTHGLAMSRRGNVIWVTPAAELAARERERFETHARAAELEPLASRTFALHYPRAQDVQRLLAGATGQRLLSKRGAAAADPRMNLLFVTDLAPRIEQIAGLIDAIDRPSRQVRIEARIVEGEQGFSRNLGARVALRAQGRAPAAEGAAPATDTRNALDLAARPLGGFEAA
ncbi:secretin and TonB N-terminal domain-containing protein, partial [Burkholderia diffusa]